MRHICFTGTWTKNSLHRILGSDTNWNLDNRLKVWWLRTPPLLSNGIIVDIIETNRTWIKSSFTDPLLQKLEKVILERICEPIVKIDYTWSCCQPVSIEIGLGHIVKDCREALVKNIVSYLIERHLNVKFAGSEAKSALSNLYGYPLYWTDNQSNARQCYTIHTYTAESSQTIVKINGKPDDIGLKPFICTLAWTLTTLQRVPPLMKESAIRYLETLLDRPILEKRGNEDKDSKYITIYLERELMSERLVDSLVKTLLAL